MKIPHFKRKTKITNVYNLNLSDLIEAASEIKEFKEEIDQLKAKVERHGIQIRDISRWERENRDKINKIGLFGDAAMDDTVSYLGRRK